MKNAIHSDKEGTLATRLRKGLFLVGTYGEGQITLTEGFQTILLRWSLSKLQRRVEHNLFTKITRKYTPTRQSVLKTDNCTLEAKKTIYNSGTSEPHLSCREGWQNMR
jgi:hypothetical protein